LRLSRAETTELGHIRHEIGSVRSPAALGNLYGAEVATDVLLSRAVVMEKPLAAHWQADVARGVAAVFPVSAANLMPGLQGPALGVALAAMKSRWLESDLALTRDQLLT